MVLQTLSTVISRAIPSRYYTPSIATLVVLIITYAYSQGRRTTRDRDLHARVIILTGAFTSLGLTLLEHLAKKGAHVIVLLPTPSLTSAQDELLTLLRTTTSNEFIYAEPCPLESPQAIKEFCQKFATTENEQFRRIDALILAHEYNHIGVWKTGSLDRPEVYDSESTARDTRSMATFLLITLLLPAMIVAPADRDIRIINAVNPFYAAAAKNFDSKLASKTFHGKDNLKISKSTILSEGQRALRVIVFTRHLQRILDALPSPNSLKPRRSNIMAISVSPGISRADTVIPFLFPPAELPDDFVLIRWIGTILYLIFSPLMYLFTRSPASSMQSILHVLCVPRPTASLSMGDAVRVPQPQIPNDKNNEKVTPTKATENDESLVPGALYADCSIVKLALGDDEVTPSPQGQVPDVTRLGLGNEGLGRSVWEVLEEGVQVWEKEKDRKTNLGH